MSRRSRRSLAAVLCALGLMGAAIAVAPASAATHKTYTVKLSDFKFSPKSLTAHAGDQVKFVWVQGVHNVVSTSGPQKVNSGAPAGGRKPYTIKLAKKGTLKLICVPHQSLGMKMTIKVT
jgi:plastocyanin